MIAVAPGASARAVLHADAWLESLRATPVAGCAGYGGPVVHWWRDSTLFCGPGFDWRYEGIIAGYLALYRRAGERRWLAKAIRAGDDLVAAQLGNGSYRHSGFELNPVSGGTPHEAAADIGLLALAAELRHRGEPSWDRYLATARHNLSAFYVARLWDEGARRFADDPQRRSFVPNKAATVAEALFRLAELTGEAEWIDRYALPTLDAVVALQHRRAGDPLDGGIAQNSIGGTRVEKFFPFYVARCVPALLEAARWHPRYLDSAMAAGAFLLRWRDPDGAYPQVVYPAGRVNRYPRWVGGLGDILRALALLNARGLDADVAPSRTWLLGRQLANGAFRPAEGFASQVSQRPPRGLPDVRDLLPVAGWADKAFRYLAEQGDGAATGQPAAGRGPVVELPCAVHGRRASYREDDVAVEVALGQTVCYRWRKGEPWAEVVGERPPAPLSRRWSRWRRGRG